MFYLMANFHQFQPKKYDFNLYKKNLMKNLALISQIFKELFVKIAIFLS
jgi:hypothetical protein